MPIETASYIADLTSANPLTSDPVGQGDDHLRLIKGVLQNTFPQMGNVFSRTIRTDAALSLSSGYNTAHFVVNASATTTVVMTLPAAASITSGYYVDITTLTSAQVSVVPPGGSSIGGAASFAVPEQNTARLFYQGAGQWYGATSPNGGGTSVIGDNLNVKGTLSVSSAATFSGPVSISGIAKFNTNVTISGIAYLQGGAITSAGVTVNGALAVTALTTLGGSVTISGTTVMVGLADLRSGQIKFPATDVPSADPNTLDDYEEGTWTPTFDFVTNGNLTRVYSLQNGIYTKIGGMITIQATLTISTFTFTTASGNALLGGLPFANGSTHNAAGTIRWRGITKANYTHVVPILVPSTTNILMYTCGSAQTPAIIAAADMPTGGTPEFIYAMSYRPV